VGRKIGAVLAFVVGGAVAGASGIMLFAPETPGAFALAPLPPRSEPAIPTVVAVVPETTPVPTVGKADGVDTTEAKADRPAAVTDDRKPEVVQAAVTPAQAEAAKPAPAVSAESAAAASTAAKAATETAMFADFAVGRPIASVAPVLASTITAATVPAMLLATRQIATQSHALVSPALPALAAIRPKSVVTTAVALSAPVEETKPAPAKPRKATRSQNRNYANDYRRQQNFFSFFWR
jgi:hypothetical protein